MSGAAALEIAAMVAGVLLVAAAICAAVRIVRGPSTPDRVVALDMLSLIGVAVAGLAVIVSGSTAFVDIALGVALVGFLAVVAFAGFIERGAIRADESEDAP
ncbi:monovalent cation/H+ antiporter complex subunit F [Hyphomicrobium sp.]|uniref:monovalent cation/H+ antiporter complex subunit F n=1 Tax=Hyphomicrobium sp. TaxID=82 RepID=UPI002C80DD96|nr:monovalent cation/H+ antiporter complex subunit F [Hyphomicrobium sp.]HRN89435.1 monovalent cation/H+ antiporter complex subunit F [Hyphomicrobium sp.]HRQ27859.1 monovalent cation/H+ antiporter complex subunit F [Hyphomicrobium sp.]